MPLDPTISLQGTSAAPAQANPLDTLSGLALMQNRMNQNALFQQEFRARAAAGPIFQQSVDPATGMIDTGKLQTLISGNPDVAWKAPELMTQAIGQNKAQFDARHQQIVNAAESIATVNGALGALLKKGAGVDKGTDLAPMLADMEGQGTLQHQDVMRLLSEAPTSGEPLRSWISSHWERGMSMQQQMEAYKGKIEQMQLGSRVLQVQTPGLPEAGPPVVRGVGTPGLTPSEASTLVQAPPTAEGAKQMQPKGALAPAGGGTFEPEAGAKPGTSPGPGAKPGPASVFPVELPPQAEAAQHKLGENAGEYAAELDAGVIRLPQVMQRLGVMQSALREFQAGGGEVTRTKVASMLQAIPWVPRDVVDKVAGGSIADAQTLRAMLAPMAIENLKQVAQGTGRVMKSEVDTFLANESLSTDPNALEKIFNFTRDLGARAVDQRKAFTEYKGLVTAGKAPAGYQISDFPTWYAERMLGSGQMDFGHVTGQAKGTSPQVKRMVRGADGALGPAP